MRLVDGLLPVLESETFRLADIAIGITVYVLVQGHVIAIVVVVVVVVVITTLTVFLDRAGSCAGACAARVFTMHRSAAVQLDAGQTCWCL